MLQRAKIFAANCRRRHHPPRQFWVKNFVKFFLNFLPPQYTYFSSICDLTLGYTYVLHYAIFNSVWRPLKLMIFFVKKIGHPRPLFRLFSVFFKQTIQFFQQINVKKCHVHPVSGAGIRTYDL